MGVTDPMVRSAAKQHDVCIVGPLCGIDLTLAEALTARGLRCLVLRSWYEGAAPANVLGGITELTAFFQHYDPDRVRYFRGPLEFVREASRCRLVLSVTVGVLQGLRYLYPLKFLPGFPPVINITTGADITELAEGKSIKASLYRHHLKTSALNWIAVYPHGIKNALRLRLPNVVFLRLPFNVVEEDGTPPRLGGEIRFFHPSNLDWGASNPGAPRNTTKGNDRFIRALGRAVRAGLPARCTMLDRGLDRVLARDLIKAEGMEDRFAFVPQLTRDELFGYFTESDVVVDQFDIGGLGGISMEAMSVGRPVLTYLRESCYRLLYGSDLPPVLNCWSEDEIFARLMECGDRQMLHRQGIAARAWVGRNHHWKHCLDGLLFYYALLTGDVVEDYGWGVSAYAQPGRA